MALSLMPQEQIIYRTRTLALVSAFITMAGVMTIPLIVGLVILRTRRDVADLVITNHRLLIKRAGRSRRYRLITLDQVYYHEYYEYYYAQYNESFGGNVNIDLKDGETVRIVGVPRPPVFFRRLQEATSQYNGENTREQMSPLPTNQTEEVPNQSVRSESRARPIASGAMVIFCLAVALASFAFIGVATSAIIEPAYGTRAADWVGVAAGIAVPGMTIAAMLYLNRRRRLTSKMIRSAVATIVLSIVTVVSIALLSA